MATGFFPALQNDQLPKQEWAPLIIFEDKA